MEKSIEEVKAEFIKIYNENIKREGADKLLDYLLNGSDFFTAPASGRRHSSYEGGLAVHTLNVYYRLKALVKLQYGEDYQNYISEESIAIMALLHDVCKVNTYTTDYRNQKIDNCGLFICYCGDKRYREEHGFKKQDPPEHVFYHAKIHNEILHLSV